MCYHYVGLFLSFCVSGVLVLENGLARTPPMGWMSWGYYRCTVDCVQDPDKCLNEDLIISTAEQMSNQGYQEAGYNYIIIDDCWSEKVRDRNGRLVADRQRFPNGMKYIADFIHSKGLKFGMYTNIAEYTCERYPGSKYHFEVDAHTFASWGVDYLKVDGCFVDEDYLNVAYIDLGKSLNQTGRPMVYSCSWPYYIQFIINKQPDLTSVGKQCNMWRNYHDVFLNWASVRGIVRYYEREYPLLHDHHGPGHWNDPDMLVFGTSALTEGQLRIQLAVYAMLSAPLLLSCDMNSITEYERQLLLNMDLIAIDQDSMGIMAKPYFITSETTLWVKQHLPKKGDSYPSHSFLLVNFDDISHSVSFSPSLYGLNSTDGYTVLDVFTSTYVKNVTLNDSVTVQVPSEDAVLYTLYPL